MADTRTHSNVTRVKRRGVLEGLLARERRTYNNLKETMFLNVYCSLFAVRERQSKGQFVAAMLLFAFPPTVLRLQPLVEYRRMHLFWSRAHPVRLGSVDVDNDWDD